MQQIDTTAARVADFDGQTDGADQPNFVAFRVSRQDYCVDILSVREISGATHITPLPRSPAYVRGVINLRGAVVPVLDCPMRFGLKSPDAAASHVIIVVQVGDRTLGLLVDEVSEILNIPPSAIKPIPDAEGTRPGQLVSGIIVLGKRMIRLVDLAQVAPEIDMASQ